MTLVKLCAPECCMASCQLCRHDGRQPCQGLAVHDVHVNLSTYHMQAPRLCGSKIQACLNWCLQHAPGLASETAMAPAGRPAGAVGWAGEGHGADLDTKLLRGPLFPVLWLGPAGAASINAHHHSPVKKSSCGVEAPFASGRGVGHCRHCCCLRGVGHEPCVVTPKCRASVRPCAVGQAAPVRTYGSAQRADAGLTCSSVA